MESHKDLVMKMSSANSLEQTMVGPLWARATYSHMNPEILNDAEAHRIFKDLVKLRPIAPADMAIVQRMMSEFQGLKFLFRARSFDNAIKKFVATHPRATIVNIGCGLDTTFSRVDNGQLLWYDLDLPEMITLRTRLIPETPRCKVIPKSIFDLSCFDSMDFSTEKGIYFLAGGLFYYFKEEAVATRVRGMASRFPGGELIFDASSTQGNEIMSRTMEMAGVKDVNRYFGLDDVKTQIARWDPALKVVDEFPLFSRLPRNPKWSRETHKMMEECDKSRRYTVVQVKFPGA